MALKSIKNKITNLAGGEVLGEAASPQEIKEQKAKNTNKLKKERGNTKITRPTRPPKHDEQEDNLKPNVELKSNVIKSIEKERPKIVSKDVIEGYEDVLSILGIKENIDLDVDFKSNQLDYVEFTQTKPLGFDFEEVTEFISLVKYTMYKLEAALEQRDKDIVKVASEVKRVEQKMIEQNQEKELERMIGGMTEEERLIEENMELKVEVNELTRKLQDTSNNSEKFKSLNNQIEALRAENDILRMNGFNKKDESVKLPSFEEETKELEERDPFKDMLEDIGGLYDE